MIFSPSPGAAVRPAFRRLALIGLGALLALGSQPRVRAQAVGEEARAEILERVARGYYPGRFGDLAVIPADGAILTWDQASYRFMHGSPWEYDARIPLILYGPGFVRPGSYAGPVSHQSIGVTLETLLGLGRLPTATGRVLWEALTESATDEPPRLIAVLVLDGFRPDYLERFPDRLPTLRWLREEGAWLPDARADYLPTATAVAHTTMVTGTDPAVHGITGNTLYDRALRQPANIYAGASPRNLMTASLVDRWADATEGRARIAVQAGTFYPAAALAGHGRCILGGRTVLASFYDAAAGRWATNPECYELAPDLSEVEARSVWKAVGGRWLGHAVDSPGEFRRTSLFARFEGEAAVGTIRGQTMGEDETPDLFLGNLKSGDYVSHKYGPFSPEMAETVAEIDRQVGRVVEALEEAAGPDGYLLVVTADHGMPDEPSSGNERRSYADVRAMVDQRFAGAGAPVVTYFEGAENRMYLDRERLGELGITIRDVAAYLESLPFVAWIFTADEVRSAQRDREDRRSTDAR